MTGPCGEAAAALEKCWAELISRDTDKAALNPVLSTATKAPFAISGNQTGELPAGVSCQMNSVPSPQVSPLVGKGPEDLLELVHYAPVWLLLKPLALPVLCSGDSLQLLQSPRVVYVNTVNEGKHLMARPHSMWERRGARKPCITDSNTKR